jgi:hypothetical protein
VVFAILFFMCKVVLFVKPIIGFSYCTKTIIWLLGLRKIHWSCCIFWWIEVSKEVRFVFPFRELRRSPITLYKVCDFNLVEFTTFYQTRSV